MVSSKRSNLRLVAARESGVGLPFALENCPHHGDVWRWSVGKRYTAGGYYSDRCLIAPKRLQKHPRKKIFIKSKKQIKKFFESEFPGKDFEMFWKSFRWEIPAIDAEVNWGKKLKVSEGCSEEVSEHGEGSEEDNADVMDDGIEEEDVEERPIDESVQRMEEFKQEEEERKRETEVVAATRGVTRAAVEKGNGKMKGNGKEKVAGCFGVGTRTRSGRVTAIGIQWSNTKDNPIVLDEEFEGPFMRSAAVEGVSLIVRAYQKDGKVGVKMKEMLKVVENAIPVVKEEDKEALFEAQRKILAGLENKSAGVGDLQFQWL